MFSNLTGWHAIIIGVLVVAAIAVVVVVILMARRRPSAQGIGGPAGPARDTSTRLAELTDLRDRGQISDAEYEARRRRILDEL